MYLGVELLHGDVITNEKTDRFPRAKKTNQKNEMKFRYRCIEIYTDIDMKMEREKDREKETERTMSKTKRNYNDKHKRN